MAVDLVSALGVVGRHVPAMSSALRPNPLVELEAWGGEEVVRGRRILDLGSGDGRFALGVASLAASVDAVDPDPESIATARKTARQMGFRNARFKLGAAQDLPYADGSFEVVILSWTL